MSSKDFILGILVVIVIVLGYLFLTQTPVQVPTAPSAPANVTPPTTQPPTTEPPTTQPPTTTPPTTEPTTNVTPEPPTNVTPPTNETNDTDTGPIILTPINISQEGNGTLVRVPPSSRSNNTSVLISIYPARIVVDPYDFLNDPFDFSNLIPVRGEAACKNQCDAFCLAEKNFCKDKCEDVHDDVCEDAVAQSWICKAACLQANLNFWDLMDCGEECEKEMKKACSWFTETKCKAQCGSTYYNRCIDECYETC
jgi:hypothetical protein